MALVSLQEPVKLERFQPIYRVNVKVPVDVSGIFLDDAAIVIVRVIFQNDPDGIEQFPLPGADPLAGPVAWSTLKQAPGDDPTLFFIPPFPGSYTVTLAAVSIVGGRPVRNAWKTEPIKVQG